MAKKDWKKRGIGGGIYGINGNYIWENKKNGDVLEVQSITGGRGGAVHVYKRNRTSMTIPRSGIGYRTRRLAIKSAQSYMRKN